MTAVLVVDDVNQLVHRLSDIAQAGVTVASIVAQVVPYTSGVV